MTVKSIRKANDLCRQDIKMNNTDMKNIIFIYRICQFLSLYPATCVE